VKLACWCSWMEKKGSATAAIYSKAGRVGRGRGWNPAGISPVIRPRLPFFPKSMSGPAPRPGWLAASLVLRVAHAGD
jgi:hypothetical protein